LTVPSPRLTLPDNLSGSWADSSTPSESPKVLFWSNVTADKLSLPNQENLVAVKDKKYLIESIVNGKVKGTYVCTEKFLPSIQKYSSLSQSATLASRNLSRRIIVVSGTDDEMKQAITGTLTKLSLVPLVICEEPSQGKKIVENFSRDYDDVAFAVVLLSPDDFAYVKMKLPQNAS